MVTCSASFPNSAQIRVFVTGLFSLNQDIPAFKEHLRDFLVQIKVSKCHGQIYLVNYLSFVPEHATTLVETNVFLFLWG